MSKRLLTLFSLVMPLLSTHGFAQTEASTIQPLNVELQEVGKKLQFQGSARLESVLALAKEQSASLQYSLGTTLFDKSDRAEKTSTALKNSVLNQMIQHNLIAHPFYKFIQKQNFAPRLLSAIDVDKIRLNKFDNPLLHGNVLLASPLREEKVYYLGNLNSVYSVKDQAGIPLQRQIENLKSNIGTLSTPPVLIYPDGHVVKPHHGAWLTTQYYLPPLTLVYVPFGDLEYSEMDQDIVRLLTQLIPNSTKRPQ
ncbi:TPA: YjbG polysaccharide synthesis-related protein [Vibrio parahaemolyticus]|uniref:capsule biosynthesis GfcC family protein n=1 Tax=Vibrio parahaemolyticus TaxID=670 RepID=UPI00064B13A9|nr:capsule biosynthesis GfcC family protein [Vibrio parahaemolyticus]EGR1983678.1 YjbG polysaccharide synthesis-related protein [Vibrio parahaemolyticus]EII3441672.1 capsule biosynthesis GfcC family protein [Vibrio parahaemolyticus]ELA7840504.1 capsule biosynthesis GfcC family protein [Vibrio parahaemolyticus]MDG2669838.1 capsule biosynthesis GfcC family protein [Vibrio parahaemolyticus]OXD35625.1 YjbG polysaccharide synthesis-related protein [Vibrio parahaemolyticus]